MGFSRKFDSDVRLLAERVTHMVAHKRFGQAYAIAAVAILTATTAYWSILGARNNLQNADQLVSPLLFEHPRTFHGALIPGSHSFLIKWPLFLLISLLHFNPHAYVAVTACVVLTTILMFAGILYKIERRPLLFGTIILALSSVLMMIPVSPYAGALLPVNMAMLTTRNIEYIGYMSALIGLIEAQSLRSWKFIGSLILLAFLFASDKLFLYLSLGGTATAFVVYGLRRRPMASIFTRWAAATVTAGIISLGILWLASQTLTHVVLGSSAGPYGLTHSWHDLLLGACYTILHIATNFGANPADQTTIYWEMPHQALSHLIGISGISYIINMALLIGALYAAFHFIRRDISSNTDSPVIHSGMTILPIMLLWSSLAAVIVFVLSNHYYAADARYLAVIMFSLFTVAAAYLHEQTFPTRLLIGAGLICLISTILAIPTAMRTFHDDQAAPYPISQRNLRIAHALARHPGNMLLGDYWRVVTIKFLDPSLTILPLDSCTEPRDTLSSAAWQASAQKSNFAYLLSLDKGLTNFPHCTLDQIVTAYGRPEATTIIAGSSASPQEILLYYNHPAQR